MSVFRFFEKQTFLELFQLIYLADFRTSRVFEKREVRVRVHVCARGRAGHAPSRTFVLGLKGGPAEDVKRRQKTSNEVIIEVK